MKYCQLILPLAFTLLIFTDVYSQSSQPLNVDKATEAQQYFEEGKKLISSRKYESAVEKLQLAKKAFEAAGDVCSALAVDTWMIKIDVYNNHFSPSLTNLKERKSLLERYKCSTDNLAFKNIDAILLALEHSVKAQELSMKKKTFDSLESFEKVKELLPDEIRFWEAARDIYRELNEEYMTFRCNFILGYGYLLLDLEEHEKAFPCFNEMLQSPELKDFSFEKTTVLGSLGYLYGLKGEHEKAKIFLGDAWNQAQKIQESNQWANNLLLLIPPLALEYYTKGKYEIALFYYDYALKLSTMDKDINLEKTILPVIALCSQKLLKYEQSLDYLNRLFELSRSIQDINQEENSLFLIASVYQDMGEYEKSSEYYNHALGLNKKTNNKKLKIAYIEGLGMNSFSSGKYKEAINYFNECLEYSEKTNDLTNQRAYLRNLSRCFDAIENIDKAVEFENRALEISKTLSDKKEIAASLKTLSSLYQKLGNEDSAINAWVDAYKVYAEMEDRDGIRKDLFWSVEEVEDKLQLTKYQPIVDYLKQELSSAKRKGDLKKQIFINVLFADLYYQIYEPNDNQGLSFKYYKEAYELNKNLQDQEFLKYSLIGMAQNYFYMKNEATEAFNCLHELLRFAQEKNNDALQLDAIEVLIQWSQDTGNVSGAFEYANQGLQIAQESGNENKRALFYSWLGGLNYVMGNYQEAINYRTKPSVSM